MPLGVVVLAGGTSRRFGRLHQAYLHLQGALSEQELALRPFRDRDYLKTSEGFIFVVIGNVHPLDRVIAYLKYVPDKRGRWGRAGSRFSRALQHYNVPSVMDSMRFLREHAPQYVFESDVHRIALPAVPTDRIVEHLRPEERLLEMHGDRGLDELETKALRLAELISHDARVPVDSLGVTGSILARIHDPAFSDIDLVVYGYENAVRARALLKNADQSLSGMIQRLAGVSREKWIDERVRSAPLTRQNAIDLLDRKWNIGSFDGKEFSLHAVHTETEVNERYGDECFFPLGIVNATAKIAESSGSLFMPAVYRVESANLDGRFSAYMVDRIVSFEGLYADIAKQGETVSCRGKMERVESRSEIRHRIVVGSPEAKGSDFILPSEAIRQR